tara:strand:- start:7865 stop:8335 length:471 start_codon:yes stop_codon:yes gene_type:complete
MKTTSEKLESLQKKFDDLKRDFLTANYEGIEALAEDYCIGIAHKEAAKLKEKRKRYDVLIHGLHLFNKEKENTPKLDKDIASLVKTASKYQSKHDSLRAELEVIKLDETTKEDLNAVLADLGKAKEEIKVLKDSVNRFSAERGKWLRKLKRAGVKL